MSPRHCQVPFIFLDCSTASQNTSEGHPSQQKPRALGAVLGSVDCWGASSLSSPQGPRCLWPLFPDSSLQGSIQSFIPGSLLVAAGLSRVLWWWFGAVWSRLCPARDTPVLSSQRPPCSPCCQKPDSSSKHGRYWQSFSLGSAPWLRDKKCDLLEGKWSGPTKNSFEACAHQQGKDTNNIYWRYSPFMSTADPLLALLSTKRVYPEPSQGRGKAIIDCFSTVRGDLIP